MRRRVTVVVLCVCVCVCLSVCYHASSYIARLYVSSEVSYGCLWRFQDFSRVAFAENASFKSSGVIF